MVLQLIRWNKKLLVNTTFYGVSCLSFDFLLINSMTFTFYAALRHITHQHKVSYLYVGSILSITSQNVLQLTCMYLDTYIKSVNSFESCRILKVRKYFICMYGKEDTQLNLNSFVKRWKIISSQTLRREAVMVRVFSQFLLCKIFLQGWVRICLSVWELNLISLYLLNTNFLSGPLFLHWEYTFLMEFITILTFSYLKILSQHYSYSLIH